MVYLMRVNSKIIKQHKYNFRRNCKRKKKRQTMKMIPEGSSKHGSQKEESYHDTRNSKILERARRPCLPYAF
ncbi:Uncharacterised protein [Bacillus freudenreichii]|nr:Uncharacterised protein [Bacillus freudenreichii]